MIKVFYLFMFDRYKKYRILCWYYCNLSILGVFNS